MPAAYTNPFRADLQQLSLSMSKDNVVLSASAAMEMDFLDFLNWHSELYHRYDLMEKERARAKKK